METRTCKVCGETKAAIKGIWVTSHGKPVSKLCLACKALVSLRRRITTDGMAAYLAYTKANRASINARSLARYHSNPANKIKAKHANQKLRATPEGRIKANIACLESTRIIRATQEGRAKATESSLRWARENTDKACALSMRRVASKLKRTPSWADHKKITLFYTEAARLTSATGVRHEVDHIIPLQGKLVSGLHVHNNLQVLTKSENSSKGNKWLVE